MLTPITLALSIAASPGQSDHRLKELADLVALSPDAKRDSKNRRTKTPNTPADLGAFLAQVTSTTQANHAAVAEDVKSVTVPDATTTLGKALQLKAAEANPQGVAAVSTPPASPLAGAAKQDGNLETLLGSARGPEPSNGEAIVWVLGLVLLGILSFFLAARGKKIPLRAMRVLEQTTVGKGRSLLLVEVAGQNFLLAASEAGIHVLGQPRGGGANLIPASEPRSGLLGSLGKLGGARPVAEASKVEPAFSGELARCMEDLELRQKLAAATAKRSNDGPH